MSRADTLAPLLVMGRRLALGLGVLLCGCGAEAQAPAGPEVVLHRLNRREYDHTVRDLLGTEQRPARAFAEDGLAFGFDNQAEALHLSPLQLEQYLEAAEALAEETTRPPPTRFLDGVDFAAPIGGRYRDEGWRFFAGRVEATFPALPPGRYRLSARARSIGARAPGSLSLSLDQAPLREAALSEAPQILSGEFTLSSTRAAPVAALQLSAGEAVVDWLRIDGPLEAAPCSERSCAAALAARWAHRAFRRPLLPEEPDRLLNLWDQAVADGETPEDALAAVLAALLLSPHFLFRIETAGSAETPVEPLELAARLSYFLWGSMPDEALLQRAEQGALLDHLLEEIDRMLDDPKSEGLVDGFGGSWLHGRALEAASPSTTTFPAFDEGLRASAAEEQARFFASLLAEDRALGAVLSADYTFVDARLAAHYGWADPGPGWTRVPIPESSERRGVLGEAAFLIATSNPTRSSPVRRGKWVLSELLCSAPPPPPPNVPSLPEGEVLGTQRQRFEAHRDRPECRGCHLAMDPIGFGLEVFDGLGQARRTDHGAEIDASGVLFDTTFDGPLALGRVLEGRPELAPCVTEKLVTYGLGRGVRIEERASLAALAESPGWRTLIRRFAGSPLFRGRQEARP